MVRQGRCAFTWEMCVVLAAACIAVTVADSDVEDTTVLFCVHSEDEKSECRRLRSIPPLNADCSSQDSADCLAWECVVAEDCRIEVREGNADIMMASSLGLWYLQQDYDNAYAPVVSEHRSVNTLDNRAEGLQYKAVAIALRDTCTARAQSERGPLTIDTSQGLRSCHGEYGDLAGWVAPIAKLKKAELGDGDTDIDIVSNWFRESCAPSNTGQEICSACSEPNGCDLDDPYATPLGVIQCLREDAADIGFVDNWTALGAGQPDSDDGGDADMSDLQVVCNDGCRDLAFASEADCYIAKVPSDVAIMRSAESAERLNLVRDALVEASISKQFASTFGTSSNLNGALFSHGTSHLEAVTVNTENYLGSLDSTLLQFSALFKDSTDVPQHDASDSSLVREVKAHPGAAIGLTFLGALFLGMLCGLGLMTLFCRWRMRSARHQAQYYDKDMMDAPHPIILTGSQRAHRVPDEDSYVDES